MPELHPIPRNQNVYGGSQAWDFLKDPQVIPICCKVWEPLTEHALKIWRETEEQMVGQMVKKVGQKLSHDMEAWIINDPHKS